jgi:hypothetical protein
LFCENGDGGLPTVTFVPPEAAASATGISNATVTSAVTRSSRFMLSPFSKIEDWILSQF